MAAPSTVGDCCRVEVRIKGGLVDAGDGKSDVLLFAVDIDAVAGLWVFGWVWYDHDGLCCNDGVVWFEP